MWGGLAHLREGRELLLDEEASNLKVAKKDCVKIHTYRIIDIKEKT